MPEANAKLDKTLGGKVTRTIRGAWSVFGDCTKRLVASAPSFRIRHSGMNCTPGSELT